MSAVSEDVVAIMARWRASPVAFARECLGVTLDAWQEEVLAEVGRTNRVCLKASKGPGKTALLAWVVWWFLATRLHPKVVATSVTGDNLKDGLWTELSMWQARSPFLKAAFTWSSERIVANDHPETWWASARTWPKQGDAAQQADTLAGVHADNVLFVIDEAGGVPDAVAAAAEGGLANAGHDGREAKLVIAGNPTHLEGPLYRACTSERALWYVKEISGDPDDPKRAPRVSAQWAREQILKYGRDSSYVQVNVFGNFPKVSSNALLGPDDVVKAQARVLPRHAWASEPKVLGVDVARFGDDRSVVLKRQGRLVEPPLVLRELDTMQLVGVVAGILDDWQPDACFVDQATFGVGVIDRLVQLGYDVIGVDFGGKSGDSRFHNKRAEMWWRAAEWVKSGGLLPPLPELVAELTAPTYKYSAENRIQLEKKAEVKARIGVSPDIADALALTFAAPVAHKVVDPLLPALAKHVGTTVHDYDPFKERR